MSPYFGCIFFSIIVFLIYLLGATNYLSYRKKNSCAMTYMFEYPQYVRIQLQEEIEQQFPRYGLYAYGEGFTLVKIRAMRFSGIPVLFIPGNAGSHHQVRSLASVSLRKSLKDRTPFHFDFFTVDLQAEYSALYGGVLAEQTKFVSHCIEKILQLYSNEMNSVILIGHSMGGIVAKSVLLEPNIDGSQLNTIIMLATPHQAALVLDTSIANIYQRLQDSERLFNESEVITISVGGGPNDVLVNSNQVIDQTADLNLLTTHIPGVWKSTDHLSILWCKEFVITMIRALFNSVDTSEKYPRISPDREHRLNVFNYHLLQRYAGKKMDRYQTEVYFKPGGEWIEDIRRQYTWSTADRVASTNKSHVYLMIRLIGRQDRLTIQTTNLEVRDWLFACSASKIQGHSRVCEWGWNLTNKSRIIPNEVQRLKTADLDLEELKAQRLTHVVIRVPPNNQKKGVSIGVDLHQRSDRITNLKNKFSLVNWGFGKFGTIKSHNGTIRYEVNLDNSTSTVLLKLKNIECEQPNYHHRAIVELLEPWANNISQVRLLTYQNMIPEVFFVQTTYKGNKDNKIENLGPKLKFTLDPKCAYTIEVWHGGLIDTVASTVRDRWPNIYGVTVGLLLLALAKQVDNETGWINSTMTTIITITLCFGINVGPEGFVALALLHIFAAFVCCAVVFFGSTVYNVAHRFLARVLKFSITWSDWIFQGLNQLPLLAATILLSIVPVTCGALAMFLFIALQFLKLISLYEDYLEKLLLNSLQFEFVDKFFERKKKQNNNEELENNSDTNGKPIVFQLVLFLIWCAAAIPAIPSVLTWAKNYRYSTRLTTEDPYLRICWIILISCGSAGITWIPSDTPGYYSQGIATIFRFLGWIAIIITGVGYPHQCQYLMPALIAVAVSLLAVRRLLGSSNIS